MVAVLTAACIKCANKLDVELYVQKILKPIQLSSSQKYWSLWQTGSMGCDDKEQGVSRRIRAAYKLCKQQQTKTHCEVKTQKPSTPN
jgi:hypothetical protein